MILEPDKPYTFRNYFEMGITPGDLAQEFDYSFARAVLSLPQSDQPIARLTALQSQIEEVLPLTDLANETARREVLIGSVITEVVRITRSEWKIEYPLKVELRLQGVVDYLLRSPHQLIVVEAKHEDLFRGFVQLEAELIAFDQWERLPEGELLRTAQCRGAGGTFGSSDNGGVVAVWHPQS